MDKFREGFVSELGYIHPLKAGLWWGILAGPNTSTLMLRTGMGVKGGALGDFGREPVTLLCKTDLFPLWRLFCLLSSEWSISRKLQAESSRQPTLALEAFGIIWNLKCSSHDFSYHLKWFKQEREEGRHGGDAFKVMLIRARLISPSSALLSSFSAPNIFTTNH